VVTPWSGLKVLQSNVRIDLLVSDVRLPSGLNGRHMADAARQARTEGPLRHLLRGECGDRRHGRLEAGMHVLTKPFAMQTLAHQIRSIITGS
jgi:DNA-binding response OmpR family regulator